MGDFSCKNGRELLKALIQATYSVFSKIGDHPENENLLQCYTNEHFLKVLCNTIFPYSHAAFQRYVTRYTNI